MLKLQHNWAHTIDIHHVQVAICTLTSRQIVKTHATCVYEQSDNVTESEMECAPLSSEMLRWLRTASNARALAEFALPVAEPNRDGLHQRLYATSLALNDHGVRTLRAPESTDKFTTCDRCVGVDLFQLPTCLWSGSNSRWAVRHGRCWAFQHSERKTQNWATNYHYYTVLLRLLQ